VLQRCLADRSFDLVLRSGAGYLAETIVHFRVHNGLRHLRVVESGIEEDQVIRTYDGALSEESEDSADEGFVGSSASAASSQQLRLNSSDVDQGSVEVIAPEVIAIPVTSDSSSTTVSLFNPKTTLRAVSVPDHPRPLVLMSSEYSQAVPSHTSVFNRSSVSSTCVNTIGSETVQGQKNLARALGGGSAQFFRRQSSTVDSPDGVSPLSRQLRRKKSRPILQRMRQKIVNKLRSTVSVEQQLIQEQLEQDMQRTRTRPESGKQLRRRFTDWF
jgi:hypothetical protein